MKYYWFNRKELLKKAYKKYHEEGGKEKAAKYYQDNKEIIKNKYNKYRMLSKEEKDKKRIFKKQIL